MSDSADDHRSMRAPAGGSVKNPFTGAPFAALGHPGPPRGARARCGRWPTCKWCPNEDPGLGQLRAAFLVEDRCGQAQYALNYFKDVGCFVLVVPLG